MTINKGIFVFLLLLFFSLGFIVHALFFPTVLTKNITVFTKRVIDQKPAPTLDTSNKALTHVLFDEGEFDPQVVVIRKSYYLGIMNISEKELMTLTSDNPLLITPRGYGLSEEHIVQLYEPGDYTVSSLLHPDRELKVIVK